MSSQKPLPYFKNPFLDNQFNSDFLKPFMELFNKLPVQEAKEMFEMIIETPSTLYVSFFISVLAAIHFVFVVYMIRELIQVLRGVRTDGRYKMNAIKRIGTLGQQQEGMKQQLQQVEQQLNQLEQHLQQQGQKQEERESSDSARYESLQSRVYVLDKFREGSFRWNKIHQDQEATNRTLLEASNKVTNRITKLEIKYTTAIRDLQKRLRKMDRIVADNFDVVTKYTEKIATYCTEDDEEAKKMADAISALQDHVNERLWDHRNHIKDLQRKLASLQPYYTIPTTTKRYAASESKDNDTKSKLVDFVKDMESLRSTSTSKGV